MEPILRLLDNLVSRAEMEFPASFVPGCTCCPGAEIWLSFEGRHYRVCERHFAAMAPLCYSRLCAQMGVAPLQVHTKTLPAEVFIG